MLEDIDDNFENAVDDAAPLPPEFVHGGSEKGREDGPAEESGEEECGYVDVVAEVERVHVRSLHPVREHDDEVYYEVFAAECVEFFVEFGIGDDGGRVFVFVIFLFFGFVCGCDER